MNEQELRPAERVVVSELVGDGPLLRRLALHKVPPQALHRLLLSSLAEGRRTGGR
jgi:hypothetical protein